MFPLSSLLWPILCSYETNAIGSAVDTGPDIPWLRIVLAFLFCIGIAVAAIAFMRVRNGLPTMPKALRERLIQNPDYTDLRSDRLEVVQRVGIMPSGQLLVVRRGTRNYVLYLTAHGSSEIDRFEDAADEAAL